MRPRGRGVRARLDHLDAGQQSRRSRFVAHRAYLFHLAVDLDESVTLGEREGALIVDIGPDRAQA